jgi:hypothetical protein
MPKTFERLSDVDGSVDWSAGVDSSITPTIVSNLNTNGLKRNQLSWLNNATVRDGGIRQRLGWMGLGGLSMLNQYQGIFPYQPDEGDPYFVTVVGGHVWRFYPDDIAGAVDLSAAFGLVFPITERVFFEQTEQFLIIQAGDGITLPLFWDNVTLRRSNGLTGNVDPAHQNTINEIPAATAMCYYMGRLWYAQGRTFSAGDIVRGPAGTTAYQFRDAVLKVTENPLCLGGDGFSVPTNAGNIRGIAYASNLNTQLGEGALYVGTREAIYSISVPVNRNDWIGADTNNQPLMVVALESNGWVNDRSIVSVNGDLFFQSLEPSIRSLTTAVRNFQQWGNIPISVNEQRIMSFVNRSLLRFGSGIYFDNRLLQTSLPFACPVGVAHKAIIPLNFDIISSFESRLPPCWEGMWEGMDILELTAADFGGRQRAFAMVWSDLNKRIEVWELTDYSRWDNGENRVSWYIEFPAFTWGDEFELKQLVSAELWIDKILGEVNYQMDYQVDGDPCWYPWHAWRLCTAKDTCEDVHNPVCDYPAELRESFRSTLTLPNPPRACESVSGRPSNVGYQFRPRLKIHGWCRVRGLLLHAMRVDRKLYSSMVCA